MEKFNDSLPIILALEIEIFSYSEVLDIFPSTSKKELAEIIHNILTKYKLLYVFYVDG